MRQKEEQQKKRRRKKKKRAACLRGGCNLLRAAVMIGRRGAASIPRHLITIVLPIVNADRRQISLLPLLLKASIIITKVLHENDLL